MTFTVPVRVVDVTPSAFSYLAETVYVATPGIPEPATSKSATPSRSVDAPASPNEPGVSPAPAPTSPGPVLVTVNYVRAFAAPPPFIAKIQIDPESVTVEAVERTSPLWPATALFAIVQSPAVMRASVKVET